MCPVSAHSAPWCGRSAAAITVAFACVPPTRKCTSTSSRPQAARIFARAEAQISSSP
jgi:hypothetical protein